MAFNHVGNCSCPVGCCDCGPVRNPDPEYVIYDTLKDELELTCTRYSPLTSNYYWGSDSALTSGRFLLLEVNGVKYLSGEQKLFLLEYALTKNKSIILNWEIQNDSK